jgi:triphosphatase
MKHETTPTGKPIDAETPALIDTAPAVSDAEIELKLVADEPTLDALLASPLWQKTGRSRDDRPLVSIYYDRDDFALISDGITFRVRQVGDSHVMTVKSDRHGGDMAFARGEWETVIEGPEPDLALLPADLPEHVAALIQGAPLMPMFRTEVRRRTLDLATSTGVVEVSADQGRIVVGEKELPIAEIELELKEGRQEALFHTALDIASEHDVRISVHSKSARGFELAMGRSPAFSKTNEPSYPDKVSLDTALALMLQSAYSDLLRNTAAARDGRDPEGLHQYRVALRRLRSLLSLMKTLVDGPVFEGLRNEAKALMSRLGAARDLDVFVTETLPEVHRQYPTLDGYPALAAVAEELRHTAHGDIVSALDDLRTTRFLLNLGLWIERSGWRSEATPEGSAALDEPAARFGQWIVKRLRNKALKRGRGFKDLPADERHHVRIAIKKLRYAYQFFEPLIDGSKKDRRFSKALAKLQTALGNHNDLVVMNGLLHRITESGTSSEAHMAAGFVLGRNAVLLGGDDDVLLKAWRRFKNATR